MKIQIWTTGGLDFDPDKPDMVIEGVVAAGVDAETDKDEQGIDVGTAAKTGYKRPHTVYLGPALGLKG